MFAAYVHDLNPVLWPITEQIQLRWYGLAYLAAFLVAPYSYTGVLVLAALLGWTALVAWTALNTLAVEIVPALRQPVASLYNALRFSGYAAAPPLLGLVYGSAARVGLVYAVCVLAAVVATVLIARLRLPRRDR